MSNYYTIDDPTGHNIYGVKTISALNSVQNLRTEIEENTLKLNQQNLNPSSMSYVYNPNYNITNTISTVVWSILATSIVYYVFIKL